MPDVLQETFSVTVDDAEYHFKIPTIRYDIEVSYKSSEIRRRAYPEGEGGLQNTDFSSVKFSYYCAYMELYLVKCATLWPYGFDDTDLSKVDPSNPPKVDFEKFPVEYTEVLYQVGVAFESKVAQFRRRRNIDKGTAGT